jgi:hypothetical protein
MRQQIVAWLDVLAANRASGRCNIVGSGEHMRFRRGHSELLVEAAIADLIVSVVLLSVALAVRETEVD